MAASTTTIEGEIVLSGDLAGGSDANFPQLRASGVTPGTYGVVQRMTVDVKGRVVSIGNADYTTEIAPLIPTATTSVKGIFSLGIGFVAPSGVLETAIATSSVQGIASYGAGLVITAGVVLFDQSILATATGSVFGMIKNGTNIDNAAGVLSIATATTSIKGLFSVGAGLKSTAGVIAIDASTYPSTSSSLGFVAAGSNITNTAGVLSLAIATGSVFGLVQSGTNITNTAGVFSIVDATTSVKGVASFDPTTFAVSSGAVSLINAASLTTQNTWSAAQASTVDALSSSTTYSPNFQTSAEVENLTLTANLTINFPTVLAPTGTIVRKTLYLKYKPSATTYTITLSGSYATNRILIFSNPSYTADVLHLICTDTVCYAILNEAFA